LGGVIIANELARLQNARPWRPIIILTFFHVYATSVLLPEPHFREIIDFYDLGTALVVTGLPYVFQLIAFTMLMSIDGNTTKSSALVSKEYQLSPLLIRMSLLEGYSIERSVIEKGTKKDGRYGRVLDEDNFTRICGIIGIGGLLVFICFWILFGIIGSYLTIDPVLNSVVYIICVYPSCCSNHSWRSSKVQHS